ncbi:anhydro-N-acetylmuramic acid kinase [Gluconobacter roseus]|uniref:Anhydro-N-acetylmuramic acid kinase n=1 Tax=Gluconobacter roseus NBRC 3990 TaxID=1307950 RepID=A0A4Y3M8I8_9PROT|nr:anhydro-N-acetylmuramic acid kinase [Gluconobacter roseus]GEB04843.1 anhydro-N-acetylmuramic acid kinase [Gluconobacter roseus NBRC 3990]GLP94611.1 anhydro-N-acetylmuramic acid kinase [Gluconobacter roseus NBRC 3990]
MRCLTAIGLMSGTSLDGVDAALVRTDGEKIVSHGPGLSLEYSPELRNRARDLLSRAATTSPDDPELRAIERDITLRHIEAVELLRRQTDTIDLIGFHGQTILHAPERQLTWQIGDAALLSRETGLPVIHDFRSADVAAGGEGAPLAPWYHAALLHGHEGSVAILNIGGVANVTLVDAGGDIHACDTGPGNALLDDWAFLHTGTACDIDGALARSGMVHTDILEPLLADPYFSRPAPKSLDRLTFHRAMNAVKTLSPEDGAATLVAFTVEAIRRTPLPCQPAAWYVCGGGRRNPVLMEQLKYALPAPVLSVEKLGWNGDDLEAECFGFLAVRTLRKLPLSAPTITGAPTALTGGRLTCASLSPLPEWLAVR